MRIALADPPAFTPAYDHELAAALARAGHDVELVTSHFRFGETPEPDGYSRREVFYPASSRLFRRSRARLPLKLLEHPFGMARLARVRADVLHVQWLAAPELDRVLFRPAVPAVFTAHDLLPRRTAHKQDLWRSLFRHFERIVVHSERGRETLAAFVPAERLRVIPMPVHARDIPRRDDGRTLLFFGVIRPYRGLPDALAALEQVPDARLIVAGDPVVSIEEHLGAERVDWRLGYLPQAEMERAHAEATVALFPYRPEIDQSSSLLHALGAGVPAIVYDVGGLAEPVRAFSAGRVVPPGDVGGLAAAIRELLDDPAARAEARAGVPRAREALTWDAAAAAHLAVYRELT